MMEQKVVNQRPIVVFNHDITEKDLRIIPDNFDGDIIVHGFIESTEKISIAGNLWVYGGIICCEVEVEKDLVCEGTITCHILDVKGNFLCKGIFESCDVEVAEIN